MASYPRRRAAIACEVASIPKPHKLIARFVDNAKRDATVGNRDADSARCPLSKAVLTVFRKSIMSVVIARRQRRLPLSGCLKWNQLIVGLNKISTRFFIGKPTLTRPSRLSLRRSESHRSAASTGSFPLRLALFLHGVPMPTKKSSGIIQS